MKTSDLVQIAASLSAANLIGNQVVGGIVHPVLVGAIGYGLTQTKNLKIAGDTMLAYGGVNLLKRVLTKNNMSFVGQTLPGPTGDGIFNLKIGKAPITGMVGMKGMRGVSAEDARFLLNGHINRNSNPMDIRNLLIN